MRIVQVIAVIVCAFINENVIAASFDEKFMEELVNKEYQNENAVTYIRIFNGIIPIPNRYAFIANKTDHQATFMSGSGSILLGRYDDLERLDEPFIEYVSKTKIATTKYCGLNVVEHGEYGGVFFIHNEKEYIVLLDQNKDLWKLLLFVYCQNLQSESKELPDPLLKNPPDTTDR